MKYFVFSDSHGCSKNMETILRDQLPDELIFLGDGELDLLPIRKKYPDLKIHHVRGNCDLTSSARETLIIQCGRKKIFACHGHTLGVKESVDQLISKAFDSEADVVLYGHTHIPYTAYTMAMEILNPGSIGDVPDPTYGLVEINGFNVRTMILHINNRNLK